MGNEENNAPVETNTTNMQIDAFGNYVNAGQTPTTGEKKKVDSKVYFIIGGIVAALAVVIILLNTLGGGSAKGVAQKYANAYKNYDAAAVVKLLPQDLIKASKEDDEDLEESLQEIFDGLKDLDIKITKAEVDDGTELSKEDIEDADWLFEMYGMEPSEVTEAIVFEITLEATKDDETQEGSEKITVVKYKGSWGLIPDDIS